MPPPDVVRMGELRDAITDKLKAIDEWIDFLDGEIAAREQEGAAAPVIDGLKARRAAVASTREKLSAMNVFVPFLCCDQFMNCPPGN